MILSAPIAVCLALGSYVVEAASTFSPARPPAIPLAVKSPYLSTWLRAGSQGGNGGYLAGDWPVHWTDKTTGWSGLISVDGKTYQWMGRPASSIKDHGDIPNVEQTAFEYSSTKSIFTLNAGGLVELLVTFLSPVNPTDYKRQSLPLSYMNVAVKSLDGNEHDVQIYSDISGEWASGTRDSVIEWDSDEHGKTMGHKIYRRDQDVFDESDKPDGNGMAQWGTVYYVTDRGGDVTRQSGADAAVRSAFVSNGKLDNSEETKFRAINDDWPVFAFARDMGKVGNDAKHMLFTIGLLQDKAIQFLGKDGIVALPSLWKSYFRSEYHAVNFFHCDWEHQQKEASDIDAKVKDASVQAAGDNYAKITALSVRQAFGAMQAVGTDSKKYFFMKEISSNGNTQTIDVVFPLHPIILFFNPDMLKLLMDPMYENQESGHYPNAYSMHDLGTHYPNATGHTDGNDEKMPVEECGNMLIMTLAYAQHANDNEYLNQHYPILKQWTKFLQESALIPASQLSTDDFAGTLQNQTNLALKGILGIRAMGEIACLTGHAEDAQSYNAMAEEYIKKWMEYGISQDGTHTTLNYGAEESHGLLYNLWADVELGLKLVPRSVYEMQSRFYPSVAEEFGMPLDTRHGWTKADWEIFTAAYCGPETRDMFIDKVAKYIDTTSISRPFSDLYITKDGSFPSNGPYFVARPVMGGTFALLVKGPEKSCGVGKEKRREMEWHA